MFKITLQGLGDAFIRVLAFFRLLDEEGNLSITNISAMLIVGKVVFHEEVVTNDLVALLTVLSGYQFKRYIQRGK